MFGHFDGRTLLGALATPLYEAVCFAMDCHPGEDRPFLFDDSDQWLEEKLAALYENVRSGGSIVDAIEPVLKSFEKSQL